MSSGRNLLDGGNVGEARQLFQKLYSPYTRDDAHVDECGKLVRDALESLIEILKMPEIPYLTSADWWLQRERISSGVTQRAVGASDTEWATWHLFFPVLVIPVLVISLTEGTTSPLIIFSIFTVGFLVGFLPSLKWGAGTILLLLPLFLIGAPYSWNVSLILHTKPVEDGFSVMLPWVGGLFAGWFLGYTYHLRHWLNAAFANGPFSMLWVRVVPGQERKIVSLWEIVETDGNGKIIEVKRAHTFRYLEKRLNTHRGPRGFFPKLRRQKKHTSMWTHLYPAFVRERGVLDISHPVAVNGVWGRFGLEWVTRIMVHGWVPLRFTDDALLNTPGLTEEKIREFFAKPYLDLSSPPGYEEFVASQGD